MNEKQQQLIFDKGITNIPSDAICSDNALEESLGMVYDNGEHRVIQKPEAFITSAKDGNSTISIPTILYVHRFNNEVRYIGYITSNTEGQSPTYPLVWGVKDDAVFKKKGGFTFNNAPLYYSEGMQVTSVGKTLIISGVNGIYYFLWKGDTYPIYQSLGNDIPRPKVWFSMDSLRTETDKIRADGMLEYVDNMVVAIKNGKQDDWNNAVVGLYSMLRKRLHRRKLFHGAFCVRVALELYDGSYYHISNPIFMVNQFHAKGIGVIWGKNADFDLFNVEMSQEGQFLSYYMPSDQDYTQWSDIVKNVVVFMTEDADLYDTTIDEPVTYMGSNTVQSYFMQLSLVHGNIIQQGTEYEPAALPDATHMDRRVPYFILEEKDDSELENTIKKGVYYRLFDIGIKGDGQWHNAGDHFEVHSLENLTTQEQLGEDDYFSHSILKPNLLYSYNSRLNIANAYRSVFEGFDFFMPFDNDDPISYTFYVEVNTNSGIKTVSHTHSTRQKQGIYFYYPDSRATHVYIKKGNNFILDAPLKEHPTLNGAYYFAGVSPTMDEPSTITVSPEPSVSTDLFEFLPNTLITSEVNNPFIFKAEGYNEVGTGEVIGMSTITQALSEGQFGQFPLLVFCSDGIWALTVNNTGLYSKAQPMSREVCNNRNSITQTDGAVFFSSEKGLMVIVGSQVKCVSEQLSGKDGNFDYTVNMGENFRAYLSDPACSIAYDYRDSLLWIINNNIKRTNQSVCWVYNIKNGTFSKQEGQVAEGQVAEGQVAFVRTINHYPDTLLQDDDGKVYSLLSRPDVAHDEETYSATLVTRPLKLENALALKSILQVRHITAFHPYTVSVEGQGTVSGDSVATFPSLTFKIYASNNLTSWVQLNSLRGTPWKYYRFVYTFTNLRADDHFAGSVLITQERRTNRLR